MTDPAHSDPDPDPDRPKERSRVGRWLFTSDGPDSPSNARRNAVFLTAAAGLYVFLILGSSLPPRGWSGWIQAAIAVLLIVAAANAWRGYRKVAQSAAPPPGESDEPRQ